MSSNLLPEVLPSPVSSTIAVGYETGANWKGLARRRQRQSDIVLATCGPTL
jgi:hypothetical protein